MSTFNPVIALIHNVTGNSWHPVVFTESPMPGPPEPGKPIRHKSKMHHTIGFGTREEAELNATNDLLPRVREQFIGEPQLKLDHVFEWDGSGIPTLVAFFE